SLDGAAKSARAAGASNRYWRPQYSHVTSTRPLSASAASTSAAPAMRGAFSERGVLVGRGGQALEENAARRAARGRQHETAGQLLGRREIVLDRRRDRVAF